MPELPEVEIIRQYLDEQLPGRTIACTDILLPRQLKYPEPEAFQSLVAGKRMKGMRRRGKYLLLDLHDGSIIVFHLRMTGSLVYDPSGRQRDAYARMVFHLAGGGALVFADVRTFGCVYGFAAGEEIAVPGLQSLGPEPLSDAFTPAYLAQAVRGRKQPIKSFLLDQRRIAARADIGNNGIHGGFHIGFGANIAVQNFLGAYFIKIIQANHCASASFSLFKSSVIR